MLCLAGDTNKSIFLDTIKGVLDDDSFKITSTTVSEARRVAVALLEWCKADDNKQKLGIFYKHYSKLSRNH